MQIPMHSLWANKGKHRLAHQGLNPWGRCYSVSEHQIDKLDGVQILNRTPVQWQIQQESLGIMENWFLDLRGEGLKSFFIVMDKLLLKDTAKMLCTFKTLEGFKQLNQSSGAELFMVLGCHLNTDL